MKSVRPRHLVHRGRVEAGALFFDPALLGEAATRKRLLAHWASGAVVFRAAGGYVLRLPTPRAVHCGRADALPLTVLPGGALSSAPLTAAERAALEPPAGALLLVRGGEARMVRPGEADVVDVSRWLALGAYASPTEVDSLGDPPAPPAVRVAAAVPMRQVFRGAVGGPPEEFGAVIAALRARAMAGGSTPKGNRATSTSKGGGVATDAPGGLPPERLPFHLALLTAIRAMLLRATAFLAAGPRREAPPGAGATRAVPGLATAPAPPPGPSRLARWAAALNQALARALVATRLAQALGRRHAEYLDGVMQMFRRGDLGEALRHAIPLGGDGDENGGIDLAALLRSLGPREGLEISGAAGKQGPSLGLGKSLYEQLREMYRAAFQKLEAEGRIEEAAFVLAELLRESEEAVAFLERHGRLEMAARVAEARRLAPGLVVRQWFLAGDAERAVLIARQSGAFADAVLRLEKSNPASAAGLRLLWARTLAAAGDYAGAAEIAGRIAPPPDELRQWIELAADAGGVAGARMLGRMLTLWPETYPRVLARAREIYAGTEIERAHERVALLHAIASVPHANERAVLARIALRSLVQAAALTGDAEVSTAATQALAAANDPVVRADMPTWATYARVALSARPSPIALTVPATDGGTLGAFDAALLPDGRMLLALGEAGLRVLTRDGRTVVHLDEPAHALVVSDHGDRAIAVAKRARGLRLARVDLRARRAAPWGETKLGAYACDFDGSTWVVGAGADLCAADATAEGFTLLRKVVDMGAGVSSIGRDANGCAVLTDGGVEQHDECWRFDNAGWVLRGRGEVGLAREAKAPPEGSGVAFKLMPGAVAANGVWAMLGMGAPGPVVLECGGTAVPRSVVVQSEPSASRRGCGVWTDGVWIACAFAVAGGMRVCFYDVAQMGQRASVVLGGATRVFARFGQGALVLGDDRGRLMALDLRSGSWRRDLRV